MSAATDRNKREMPKAKARDDARAKAMRTPTARDLKSAVDRGYGKKR